MDHQARLEAAVGTEELVRWTMDLVRIPSYPGTENQETAVARYLHGLLTAEGIDCQLQEVEDGRCNLIARLKGAGAGPTLMLNGHLDTIKPDGMPRATDPYLEDGRIYGRGAADMKGPVACMAAALIGLKRAGLTLEGELLFTGVIDEELNSLGTIHLIQQGCTANAAIVGEPTNLELCIGHRGLEWYEFRFAGKAVHGGRQDEGVNAISQAVAFINEVDATLRPEIYRRTHPVLRNATLNYGVIQGGTQLSTVPGECSLFVDRRFLPDEDYHQVNREFQEVIDRLARRDPNFKCEMLPHSCQMKPGYYHPPLETSAGHPLALLAGELLATVRGQPAATTLFPAWTDGALLSQRLGIPTIVVGPGDIEECHSATEHIAVEQLGKGYLFYALAALRYCGAVPRG